MIVIYYLLIAPFSHLPFCVLYRISDLLFCIFYYVIPYRKKVIFKNLRNSFPEKSGMEITLIAKKYYRHLCDLIVESLKAFSISEKEVRRRFVCLNPEVANRYFDAGKSIIFVGGHYNNWEILAVGIDWQIKHQSVAIYKTLSNKFMDRIMNRTRSSFGLKLISTTEVKAFFKSNKNTLTATIFANDQSPANTTKCHWMTFLNQDTPVLFGPEKYAVEYNYPAIYGRINKVKRGYYTFEMVDLCPEPAKSKHGFITEESTKLLEQDIRNAPEFWLWSHKRWKHKRPV